MGRSFRSRLAALHLAVVAATLAAVGLAAAPLVRDALVDAAASRLEARARLVAALLPGDGAPLGPFVRGLRLEPDERVTLLAEDGRGLADSHADPALLGNLGDRPEVAAATKAGVGSASRSSAATGRPSLFVAVRVDAAPGPGNAAPGLAGGSPVRFVRLALPLARVYAPLGPAGLVVVAGLLLGAVLGGAAALAASGALRARAAALAAYAGAVTRGDAWESTRARLGLTGSDELGALERQLAAAAGDLRTYVAALAEQRRRIEAIVGSMDEGLIVVTGTGEVLLVNGVAERMLGIESGAWRGRTLLELTRHPDLHALLEEASGGEGRAAGDVRFTSPRELDLSVSVAPLRGEADAEGAAGGGGAPGHRRAPGHVLVLRDVTRLRRLERSRTDFVANVSHELKTPLAAIRASLETLADWALEDPAGARRYLAICLSHAERLNRLIDDLLVLSNIELGQVRLSRQPVDLGGAVDETFALLAAKAADRGVRLVNAVPEQLAPFLVDRNQLLQILLNLADNGIKFTPRDGTVTVSGEPAPGPWGAVVVADTGVGVPRRDLPRLGERFYRVDKGRSRDAGGTGLGLAIVKHLAQLHGGRLEITSEVGRGTTVRVVLPVAAEPQDAPAGR